jgi:hypothetical protein
MSCQRFGHFHHVHHVGLDPVPASLDLRHQPRHLVPVEGIIAVTGSDVLKRHLLLSQQQH